MIEEYLHEFSNNGIEIPKSLPYPCHYYPNDLAKKAAENFQSKLKEKGASWHDFYKETSSEYSGGKMIGVLVVLHENSFQYIAAFSGKLGGKTKVQGFVPPVFDLQDSDNYYLAEEKKLIEINQKVRDLEQSNKRKTLKTNLTKLKKEAALQIESQKAFNKKQKEERKLMRNQPGIDLKKLDFQSENNDRTLKALKKKWKQNLELAENNLIELEQSIQELKSLRKETSAKVQEKMFQSYVIHNFEGEQRNVYDIFWSTLKKVPPAAAGDCAAPKLFHFAQQNNLQPIALAEFWWGTPPKGTLKKQGNYYPACRAKCEPILNFQLKGLKVESNPILEEMENIEIEVLFEDEEIIVINKPTKLLSVPGNTPLPSITTWLLENRPTIKGPGLVHRLDMGTSGILLAAKTKRSHQLLQKQFANKSIQKEYIALLENQIDSQSGTIELPLRPDIDDRPRQMVCYDYGKVAKTEYQVLKIEDNKTRVLFKPITGRTHQLRVHAAHKDGLNSPIEGDFLYGKGSKRLKLHAAKITFVHPTTREIVSIESPCPF